MSLNSLIDEVFEEKKELMQELDEEEVREDILNLSHTMDGDTRNLSKEEMKNRIEKVVASEAMGHLLDDLSDEEKEVVKESLENDFVIGWGGYGMKINNLEGEDKDITVNIEVQTISEAEDILWSLINDVKENDEIETDVMADMLKSYAKKLD